MADKNSALLLVLPSLSSSSSMVSTGDSGFRTLRRIHTRLSSSLGSNSSSLRVPLLLMSMAGKTRLSTSLRSRWISMLPRSEEHTSELQSLRHLVCRLLLGKKHHTTELHSLMQHGCRIIVEEQKS